MNAVGLKIDSRIEMHPLINEDLKASNEDWWFQ